MRTSALCQKYGFGHTLVWTHLWLRKQEFPEKKTVIIGVSKFESALESESPTEALRNLMRKVIYYISR